MKRKASSNPLKNKRKRAKVATVFTALFFFLFMSFSALSSEALAQDDTLEHTLRSTIYGGVIGGLLGAAVVLLTDDPEDNLGYIPAGAGIGMLGGAAYGIASSGVVHTSAVEVDEKGEVDFHLPQVQRVVLYDENTQGKEVINKVDLFKLNF